MLGTLPTFLPPAPTHLSLPPKMGLPQHSHKHAPPVTPTTTRPALTYSIAPMMEVTDRHFRTLTRLISRKATLYTEMVVDRTLIHNTSLRDHALHIPEIPDIPSGQHPIALQLGGSDPDELEAAARIAAKYGYDEVNLNCGCPSAKVAGKGCFGAALMRDPGLVAECCRRMRETLPDGIEVTVKCRIGVDGEESYEGLAKFVEIVHRDGLVGHFIVHARTAILGGLSPAQNRRIPKLRYEVVHRLVEDFPEVKFSINGGIRTVGEVERELGKGMHGVMVGRAVMERPWEALCEVDGVVFGEKFVGEDGRGVTRRKVLDGYLRYAEKEVERGGSRRRVLQPVLGLFCGERNGKRFRRCIDEGLRDGFEVREIVEKAIDVIDDDVLDREPHLDVIIPIPS